MKWIKWNVHGDLFAGVICVVFCIFIICSIMLHSRSKSDNTEVIKRFEEISNQQYNDGDRSSRLIVLKDNDTNKNYLLIRGSDCVTITEMK